MAEMAAAIALEALTMHLRRRRAMDGGDRVAGLHLRKPRGEGRLDRLMHAALMGTGRADHEVARAVGGIAVDDAADIDLDGSTRRGAAGRRPGIRPDGDVFPGLARLRDGA